MSPEGSLPAGRTKHGTLTLDDLAAIQPGMARLMDEFGRRYWVLYYAARAGNWALARHELGEMTKLERVMATTRPKYTEALEAFDRACMEPLRAAVAAQDWGAFEAAYEAGIEASDRYHDDFAKAFIRYRRPVRPPDWLVLEPSEG